MRRGHSLFFYPFLYRLWALWVQARGRGFNEEGEQCCKAGIGRLFQLTLSGDIFQGVGFEFLGKSKPFLATLL